MLHTVHDYTRMELPEKKMRTLFQRIAHNEAELQTKELYVIAVSDYKIRKLNRNFRQKDKVTDVLSFPYHEPDLLGEIYISLPRAAIQARRYGVSYFDEILRLFVHGIFHLLGYTHDTEQNRREMEAREHTYICLDASD